MEYVVRAFLSLLGLSVLLASGARGPAVLPHRTRHRPARQRHGLPRPRGRARGHGAGPGARERHHRDPQRPDHRRRCATWPRRPAPACGISRDRRSTPASSTPTPTWAWTRCREGGDVGPTHWNPQVRAWFSTTANLKDDSTRRAALRSLGFGTALAVPKQGIFRGTASVVNLERRRRPRARAAPRPGAVGGLPALLRARRLVPELRHGHDRAHEADLHGRRVVHPRPGRLRGERALRAAPRDERGARRAQAARSKGSSRCSSRRRAKRTTCGRTSSPASTSSTPWFRGSGAGVPPRRRAQGTHATRSSCRSTSPTRPTCRTRRPR